MGDASSGIVLTGMSTDEYQDYVREAVQGYAEQKQAAGQWAAGEALEKARESYAELLPQGPATPGQLLYVARSEADGERVGILWLALRHTAGRPEAYVYDIAVDEGLRGRGYGRAVMLAAIDQARALGADHLGLHVFGHNTAARSLYESLGFVATNISMRLEL